MQQLPRRISVSVIALLTGVVIQLPLAQPQSRPKIEVSKLGPQVGQRVPDFSLQDQAGKTWTLHSIMGPRGAMLVFLRSADW